MPPDVRAESAFVVDLLTTLHKARFSPSGWYHFLGRSWEMAWTTARAHPQLRHSWMRVTVGMAMIIVALLLCVGLTEGAGAALRCTPVALLCIAWQASDLFWHLGLNLHPRTGQLFQRIGWATIFTLARGTGTALLLGRYTGGLPTSNTLLFVLFLSGVVTDILDGQIARRTHTESKLGRILDAETDFCQYLTIALILLQNGILPPWFMLVFLLRFCLPLVAALGSYFLLARPIRFGSTAWGKWTGIVQGCYLCILMLPPGVQRATHFLETPLLIATLILLIGAPLALLRANGREEKTLVRSKL